MDELDGWLILGCVALLGAGMIIIGRQVRQHDDDLAAVRESLRMHVHEQQIGVSD